jgi:hypothetical protein
MAVRRSAQQHGQLPAPEPEAPHRRTAGKRRGPASGVHPPQRPRQYLARSRRCAAGGRGPTGRHARRRRRKRLRAAVRHRLRRAAQRRRGHRPRRRRVGRDAVRRRRRDRRRAPSASANRSRNAGAVQARRQQPAHQRRAEAVEGSQRRRQSGAVAHFAMEPLRQAVGRRPTAATGNRQATARQAFGKESPGADPPGAASDRSPQAVVGTVGRSGRRAAAARRLRPAAQHGRGGTGQRATGSARLAPADRTHLGGDRRPNGAHRSAGTPFDHHGLARHAGRLSESCQGPAPSGRRMGKQAAAGPRDPPGTRTRTRAGTSRPASVDPRPAAAYPVAGQRLQSPDGETECGRAVRPEAARPTRTPRGQVGRLARGAGSCRTAAGDSAGPQARRRRSAVGRCTRRVAADRETGGNRAEQTAALPRHARTA